MTTRILTGDCRAILPTLDAESVNCCVTSPPYFGLRDYSTATWDGGSPACDHIAMAIGMSAKNTLGPNGHLPPTNSANVGKVRQYSTNCAKCGAVRIDKQMGLEQTPAEYIAGMVAVFRDVRRVLRDDGTCWIVIGDSYRDKQLQMMPARLALALVDDGWILRSDCIWAKPNPMPESVQGSHWDRHRVTIAEYENLSGLRYSEHSPRENWARYMPGMSAREVFGGETPIPAEREGASDDASEGIARGRERKTTQGISVVSRTSQQSQVRIDGQGAENSREGADEISNQFAWEVEVRRTSRADEAPTGANQATTTGQRDLRDLRENEGKEAAGLREAEGRNSPSSSGNRQGLAGDRGTPQPPLPLLRATGTPHDRPRHPGQQGRSPCEGEHCSRLPELQLREERQTDPTLLVDCPGCPKCADHNGYIFKLSAGRPTSAHEHIFLLTKSAKYWYDADAVSEQIISPVRKREKGNGESAVDTKMRGYGSHCGTDDAGRNIRNVWTIATQGYSGAHFATYPPALVEPCIKAGCPAGGTVLDPFLGSGTTLMVADRLGRNGVGIELNPVYAQLAEERITGDCPMFAELETA